MKKLLILCLVLFIPVIADARSTCVVVGQGVAATGDTTVNIGENTGNSGSIADTVLDSNNGNNNFGGHANGFLGSPDGSRKDRVLMRFDLSSISGAATIVSATLYLYDLDWASRSATCSLTIYKISNANGDWVEGTTGGTTTETGTACWSKKTYNTADWAGSLGLSTATTDYVNTALATADFTDGTSGYRAISFNADGLTVLQSWLGSTGGNGIIIVGTETSGTWTQTASSEGSDGQRPYLSITYR